MEYKTKKQIAQEIIKDIEWDNWVDEDKSRELGVKTYMKVTGVLWSKIQWIKDELFRLEDIDEHIDTLNQLELILDLVDVEQIAKYKE